MFKETAAPLPRLSYSLSEVLMMTGWNRNRLFTIISEGRLKTFKHGRNRFVSVVALSDCIKQLERETAAAEGKRGRQT
jgi:hypothetical protein